MHCLINKLTFGDPQDPAPASMSAADALMAQLVAGCNHAFLAGVPKPAAQSPEGLMRGCYFHQVVQRPAERVSKVDGKV